MNVITARGIITQCTHHELRRFHNIDGEADGDIFTTVTFSSLHSLNFSGLCPAVAFIQALTLPGLCALALTQAEWTAPVLMALHSRSQFRLESLTLANLLIKLDDFTLFLRLLPTLQDLCLESCDCTYNGFDHLDGVIIADMVELLPQQVSEQNAPFPLINSIHLSLDGPKFTAAAEERLANLSSPGFLVDKIARSS
ncbi:hypothetical protein B0H13DRAFT_2318739 [Mycena leptocephala]|nr:hypothetical protein B0H13DRAFT_2318739 [Mycena leptocephala]